MHLKHITACMLALLCIPIGGCNENDTPMSFLPPKPDDAGMDSAAADAGDGTDGGGDASQDAAAPDGGSFVASWCEPGYAVHVNPDNDDSNGTFTVRGTLSRTAMPDDFEGQVSVAVLIENPVPAYLAGEDPEVPLVQLLVRDCDWSDDSDTLDFVLEGVPRTDKGDDYFLASFYDTDKQERPLTVSSGFITASSGLTSVPSIESDPDGDVVKMDLRQNSRVP